MDLTEHTFAARGAATAGARGRPGAEADADRLLSDILASLEDDKAEDIVTIPLTGRSPIADHMVVATGRSSRQVQSIADKLAERLKTGHGIVCRIEGKELGDWVLIDAGDVIVHVFRPEVRDFYQLEKMWLPEPRTRPTEARAADLA